MLGRKAIELSLNFIVILIISIIIFGFGIRFISQLSSQATELQEITTAELDERIGNLICEGSDRVCVGIGRKTIDVDSARGTDVIGDRVDSQRTIITSRGRGGDHRG